MTPVIAPWRSEEHQTIASDHSTNCWSSLTFTFEILASSGSGGPLGSKVQGFATKIFHTWAAFSQIRRLNDRARKDT